ncbi:hypothetical protein CMV_004278 [Castanea mollissima]|uniref:Uncharacterized protein n=1 Tax=Castanea mollissima TaxID=60419 RepID=A0A8J4RFA8_9ROSI|nr:hypothetical protein CMV_004278 [Castanea mollissima]
MIKLLRDRSLKLFFCMLKRWIKARIEGDNKVFEDTHSSGGQICVLWLLQSLSERDISNKEVESDLPGFRRCL